MRTTVRTAGIVLIAGIGLLWGASAASATVPSITDPYQMPGSKSTVNAVPATAESPPATPTEESAAPPASEAPAEPVVAAEPEPLVDAEESAAVAVEEAVPVSAAAMSRATPAPEQIMTTSSRASTNIEEGPLAALSLPGRAVRTVKKGFQGFGAFLAEAVGVCQVGVATGAGGPALLVVAVLGMGVALTRHTGLKALAIVDEDAREFLYAWDVIAPG